MNSYLGQTPVFGDFPFQILSGDGTGFYELNFKTNGTNGLLVFLNGAVQRPGIDFTCDGDALTFSANVSVGVQIFVYGMGLPKSSLAPSAGSVGFGELDAAVNGKLSEIDSEIDSKLSGDSRGVATAWVNFNGTGTVAIRDSYNVLSITDNGTGLYRINFAADMDNLNYSVAVSHSVTSGTNGVASGEDANTRSLSGVGIRCRTGASASQTDDEWISVQIFGGRV